MTSTFWSSLPIAENDSSPEGIISRKPPFQLSLARVKIDDNKIGKIIVDEEITKEDMYFILENGTSSSGNSFLLDPKLGKNNVIVKLKDEKETLLGFIFSIPCSLFLKKKDGDEIIDTGMTTHLSVSNQYRNKELAKYLIAGVIDYGFHHSIYTGYHFIENPKSALPFIKSHAQEMDEKVMYQHIELYVNKYSVDLGEEGKEAIKILFKEAFEKNIIPPTDQSLFLE